ncbi:hypothetical protein FJZ36_13020 [Candidatus Poribacteria bacterium]|nr:hypothetical protein [Candidatus Poribacteria bacterium]
MLIEAILGAAAGYFLEPLYYEYVFAPYPVVRFAFLSVVPVLLIGFTSAWLVDGVHRLLRASLRAPAQKELFLHRALPLAVFASVVLQIEIAKVGSEFGLAPLTGAYIGAGAAALLAWVWARHRRYARLLTQMPDEARSVILAEAGKAAASESKSGSKGREPAPRRRVQRGATQRSQIDDVWASLSTQRASRQTGGPRRGRPHRA